MQRKLVQMGQHTLMAAIPSTWIHRHKLKKGNIVEFTEVENKLVLTSTTEIYERKITVEIISPTVEYIWRVIQPTYTSGYDEVRMNFKDRKAAPIIERFVKELIGFEIVETGKDYILIKSISKHLDEEFSTILRRVFLILAQNTQLLQEAFRSGDRKLLEGVRPLELTVNKYTMFLKRIINRSGYKYPHYMYSIVTFLELASNHLEYIRKYYELHPALKLKKDIVKECGQLSDLTIKTMDLFYNFSTEKFRWIAEAQPHFFWFEKIKDSTVKFNFKSMSEYLVQIARQIVALHT